MNLKPGERIKLTGDHPWAGNIATVVKCFSKIARVRIEDPYHFVESFVTKESQYEVIRAVQSRRKRT